jgi:phosphoglycerol transferase
MHIVIVLCGLSFFIYQFNVINFAKKRFHSTSAHDFYKSHYINPNNIVFTKLHPKSLVLIYVEGFETTYSDAALFQRNLLQRLTTFADSSISFNKFTQVSGTGWTIAGLVATQCGIPLKSVTVFGDNRQGEVINQFLSGAKCLSDILAENGYHNVYMKGASLHFGGVRQFLKTHHYTEIYGKEEWLEKGESENMSGWGLHDDALFAQAKIRLKTLIESGKLFNLTILTVDTHGIDGYLTHFCQQHGYHGFDGIVECTAHQLSDFLQYIKQEGWLNKISVVVIGDHLAMRNPVYEKLRLSPARYIFNLILAQPKIFKRTDEIVHFDLLPTILDSIGILYPGGRLGLGYSGLRGKNLFALPSNRISNLENNIENDSVTYNRLWL